MGKLAVNKLFYFISILFTFFILIFTIISYFAGNIDPNININAAYVSLIKPLLIIINIVLFIYWTIRWKYWAAVPLIGLMFCMNYITAMYKIYTPTKYSSDSKISVLTYNVHSFGREITGYSAKEFLKIANNKRVDVLCFQEYDSSSDVFTNEDIYNLFSTIYPYSYIPANKSMAIYSKFPIIDTQIIEFEKTNNGGIWADIDIKGYKIRVISVHMQTTSFDRLRSKVAKAEEKNDQESKKDLYVEYYSGSMEDNIKKRANQAKKVASIVNSTEMPVILCGDFNDTPETYTYNKLKGYLEDGFKTAGKGYAATYKGLHNLLRIDYIFYSPSLQPITYETLDFDMSDHNPVCMELGL